MLPSEIPNFNRTGCDLELEATTVWKRLARNDDNNERVKYEIPNQYFKRWSRIEWSIVSNVADRREGEKQWNSQNLKKLKYHFECKVQQFQRNKIYDRLIDIQTYGHSKKDVTEVD